MKQPLVSVVIPCYNVENYIETCLKSITSQSYVNLEIICVNDCSTDTTAEKLAILKETDERISICTHIKNQGLFRARITGIKHAHGDYIAFVDSDDHIDEDFFRCLISKASENDYDIVMGDTVHEDEQGYRWIHASYSDIIVNDRSDENVLGELLKQEGYCFIWHAVWNKIYKKSVFDRALPFFDCIKEHIIMGEDVLFSCILHYYAKSFAKTNFAYYFYLQRKGASTALDNNVNKFKKNIDDLERIFSYVNSFFDGHNVNIKFREHFDKWRELYSRYWYDNVFYSGLQSAAKQRLYSRIKKCFKTENPQHTKDSDHWFYKTSVPFDNRYIELRHKIKEFDVVSIDIFDTLIIRKVYKPTDVFLFMDKWFSNLSGRDFDFSHARVNAEKAARKSSDYEEITLDEIYETFCENNGISTEIAKKAEQKEIETEKLLCLPRKSIACLIDYAKAIGKTVVLTSDFYFNQEQLTELLSSVNARYDDLLISSEYRATKSSGKLFSILREKYSDKKILHIGNSWESDFVKARESGLEAHFYAATTSAFMYDISDINTTDSTRLYKRPTGLWDNFEHSLDFLEVRCLLAQVANRLYDNPYTSYIKSTDFNAQACFLGYYALGMHLWGVAKWLYEAQKGKNSKIHFVARDGYLPMLAYNVLNSDGSAADSDYFYASRKALFPLCWKTKDDLDCLTSQIKKATPEQLFHWFAPLLDAQKVLKTEKILISKWKNSQLEGDALSEFIKNTLAPCYDEDKKNKFYSAMKDYYSSFISNGDCIFDIGYGGRSLLHISELLCSPINGYFIHRINDQFIARQKDLGIKVNTLYDYTPSITGVVREILFSKQSPSCIGFNTTENVVPVFEADNMLYPAKFAIEEVQMQALELVKDMAPIYKLSTRLFSARSSDVSAPYEYLLHSSSPQDREYFSCVKFEDDVFFGDSAMRVTDVWQNDINYHHVMRYTESPASTAPIVQNVAEGPAPTLNYDATRGWSKLKKACYYFLFDNKTFWKKLRKRNKE